MGKTKQCPFCANEVLAKAIKCQHCGSLIAPGICIKCGKENRPEARFCGHCGRETLIPQEGGTRQPAAAPPEAGPPTSPGTPKSWALTVPALLIAGGVLYWALAARREPAVPPREPAPAPSPTTPVAAPPTASPQPFAPLPAAKPMAKPAPAAAKDPGGDPKLSPPDDRTKEPVLNLQGIIAGPDGKSKAIVNGEVVAEGEADSVSGAVVLRIKANSVDFRHAGKTLTRTIAPGGSSPPAPPPDPGTCERPLVTDQFGDAMFADLEMKEYLGRVDKGAALELLSRKVFRWTPYQSQRAINVKVLSNGSTAKAGSVGYIDFAAVSLKECFDDAP